MSFPVVKGVGYGLAHAPSLIRHGSKPHREIAVHGDVLLRMVLSHLRTYDEALAYPPNQVYIGNMRPDDLNDWPKPRYLNPVKEAKPVGPHGSFISERHFYARMVRWDHFDLIWITEEFAAELRELCSGEYNWPEEGLSTLVGHSASELSEQIEHNAAVPLFVDGDQFVGCMRRGHDVDQSLTGMVLLENLACKVTGLQALEHLLASRPDLQGDQVDYLIGCGEEAVGDRYQRGGGNIAKAIAEDAGCLHATGSDLKAFCCAPVHALVVAGALVQSGVFKNVVVLAGCSQTKLGMKFRGHLTHDMPIIEDVLASLAVWVGQDDGVNPQLRLDYVGKHDVGAGSSSQVIATSTMLDPLDAAGLKMIDVDKFGVELHDPEVTEPAGSGNVPYTNYRLLASLAVMRGEITRDQMPDFMKKHCMPGYAPTQGHIASAISFLGCARDMILEGEAKRIMFAAKGSLFLGRMTQLSDGISVMLERNGALS